MKLKNIKLKNLVPGIIIVLAYPFIKAYRADGSELLVFMDALTIISIVLIIFGIIYRLYLKGDFDLTGYFFKRSIMKDTSVSYDKFMKDAQYEKKDSFNYPLFLGIIFLIISVIASEILF